MQILTIQEQVDTFESMVIPDNASDMQVNAMRLAFMSGWWSAFQSMTQGIASLPEDAALNGIEEYRQECHRLLEIEKAKLKARSNG